MRSWREGQTSVPGFLDDHASLAVGLFSLFAATADERWYRDAIRLVGELESFSRPEGGHYSTSEEDDPLVKRPTDITDNPLPSGNALAAEALLLASLYTGESQHRDRAEAALQSVALLIDQYPSMVGRHLSVLHSSMNSRELAIVGPDWSDLAATYWARFRPHVALAASPGDNTSVPLLEDRYKSGQTLAYLCQGFVCDLPTSDPGELAAQLS